MSLRIAAIIWSMALNTPCLVLADPSLRIKSFFDLRYQYEDNVFQVPTERGEQRDFAAYIWAGVDVRAIPDAHTRIAVRYEMAPRRFADATRKNRYDHLLSGLWHRRLSRDATLLTVANLGLRHQPNDRINEYFKQDISGQLQIRWNPSWSSRFGAELRIKYFPNSKGSTYSSVMVEGGPDGGSARLHMLPPVIRPARTEALSTRESSYPTSISTWAGSARPPASGLRAWPWGGCC